MNLPLERGSGPQLVTGSPFPPCPLHHAQSSEQGSDGQLLMDEDFNNQLISIQQQLHVEEEIRNSAHGGILSFRV